MCFLFLQALNEVCQIAFGQWRTLITDIDMPEISVRPLCVGNPRFGTLHILPRRSQLMFRALGPSRALTGPRAGWGGAKARGNIAQIGESK